MTEKIDDVIQNILLLLCVALTIVYSAHFIASITPNHNEYAPAQNNPAIEHCTCNLS